MEQAFDDTSLEYEPDPFGRTLDGLTQLARAEGR